MTEEQKQKLVKWLRERPELEDLYEIAHLVWDERMRRLHEEDKQIRSYPFKQRYGETTKGMGKENT